jgi:hypothetical protein
VNPLTQFPRIRLAQITVFGSIGPAAPPTVMF